MTFSKVKLYKIIVGFFVFVLFIIIIVAVSSDPSYVSNPEETVQKTLNSTAPPTPISSKNTTPKQATINPKQIIRDLVDSTRILRKDTSWENISGSLLELQSFSNPKGEGTIVAAQGGMWIWLVSDNGTVYAVNGNAKSLTPNIKLSLEHSSKVRALDVLDLIQK